MVRTKTHASHSEMQTHSELPSFCVPLLLSRSVRQLCRGQLSGIGNSLFGTGWRIAE